MRRVHNKQWDRRNGQVYAIHLKPDYNEYIHSKEWRDRRKAYYKKHKKECASCFSTYHIGLHHVRYDHLGREWDEDLVALCWNCHEQLHDEYGTTGDLANNSYQFIDENRQIYEFSKIAKNL